MKWVETSVFKVPNPWINCMWITFVKQGFVLFETLLLKAIVMDFMQ